MHYLSRVLGSQCGGSGGLEYIVEGEREETGAVVCLSESEGINVDDDVINEVDKCGARRKAERALAREKNRRTHGHFSQPDKQTADTSGQAQVLETLAPVALQLQ